MRKQSREAWDALTPKIRAAIETATPEHDDQLWLAEKLRPIPVRYHARMVKSYADNLRTTDRRRANLAMLHISEQFQHPLINPTASDSEIREAANHAAQKAWEVATRNKDEQVSRHALLQLAARYQIDPPPHDDFGKLFNRMTSPHWWWRKLRRHFQKAEAAFIGMGFVHKHAAPYLSDEAYARFESQRRSTARLLGNLEAINTETGETFNLGELAEHSLSNPKNRRAEVMVRVKGMEHHADRMGYVGLFLTITSPSRMHAFHASGEKNKKHDESTPKRAQGYLQSKVWEPARAALARLEIDYFGLRVVEPHHDGTPHWHLLVFVKPDRKAELLDILRSYAMREDANEPGAEKHRFTVEHIDPAKGGAAAYVAKYISKNLDGEGVGIDLESGDIAARTAGRAVAWASQWGFRQFQFFGTPPVTVYRELRRLRALTPDQEAIFGAVWKAADEGRFADYLNLQAIPTGRITPLWKEEESTRYRGESTRRVIGLRIPVTDSEPVELVTRDARWEIRIKDKSEDENARFSSPWTRVNNCTPLDLRDFQTDTISPDEVFSGNPTAFIPTTRRWPEKEKPPFGIEPAGRLKNTDLTGRSVAP